MSQDARAKKIEDAAYQVFETKGFNGPSLFAIAKQSNASYLIMYKWYGSKVGLFSAMIESNTRAVVAELETAKKTGKTGLSALQDGGASRLHLVTSDRAITLNRAAAADTTGTLGKILAEQGRARVLPKLEELLKDAYGVDQDVSDQTEWFVSLLIGDLQIRRAIGAITPLEPAQIERRAALAIQRLKTIYPLPNGGA